MTAYTVDKITEDGRRRLESENPHRGHRRIHGELTRLGHKIAAATVRNILHKAGIDPAPRRSGPTWKQFLAAQAEHILTVDFLHVETITLRRIYALVLLEHGSRRAHLLGVTANPAGEWTTQAARNFLMDDENGLDATSPRFLIRDRGGQFTDTFDAVFTDALRNRCLTSVEWTPPHLHTAGLAEQRTR